MCGTRGRGGGDFYQSFNQVRQVVDWFCLEQPARQEPILLKGMGLHKALLD